MKQEQENNPTTKRKQPSKKPINFLRYATMGTEMAAIIGVCVGLGLFGDNQLGSKPWLTLVGALLGVGLSLYRFIKDALSE